MVERVNQRKELDLVTALELDIGEKFEQKFNALKKLQGKKIKSLVTIIDSKDREIKKLQIMQKPNRTAEMVQILKEKIKEHEYVNRICKEEWLKLWLEKAREEDTEKPKETLKKDLEIKINKAILRKTVDGGPKRFRPLTREEMENKYHELEKKVALQEKKSKELEEAKKDSEEKVKKLENEISEYKVKEKRNHLIDRADSKDYGSAKGEDNKSVRSESKGQNNPTSESKSIKDVAVDVVVEELILELNELKAENEALNNIVMKRNSEVQGESDGESKRKAEEAEYKRRCETAEKELKGIQKIIEKAADEVSTALELSEKEVSKSSQKLESTTEELEELKDKFEKISAEGRELDRQNQDLLERIEEFKANQSFKYVTADYNIQQRDIFIQSIEKEKDLLKKEIEKITEEKRKLEEENKKIANLKEKSRAQATEIKELKSNLQLMKSLRDSAIGENNPDNRSSRK